MSSQALINLMSQPITFADYMNLVLYHPQYGYYSSGKVGIGSQGDYFTSSSLGSDFGELLAQQVVEIWKILGKPNPFYLVEMGVGTGFLAKDIISSLQKIKASICQNLHYLMIETSPALKKQQKETLKDLLTQSVPISWQSWEEIEDNFLVGCLLSNELVDAFPVHRVMVKNKQLKEIYVTGSEGELREVIKDLSTPRLLEYFSLVNIDLLSSEYPDNYTTEVNLAALDWLKIISKKLRKGYVITIDYGYSAAKYYHPQRHQGTLNCYYQHHHHPNPYVNLGEQDITTHLDFTALENYGKQLGLESLGLTQQGLFLMALGLGNKLNELSQGTLSVPEIIQRRDALHQLINPMGLGGFKVLIQSKGLSAQEKEQKLRGLTDLEGL